MEFDKTYAVGKVADCAEVNLQHVVRVPIADDKTFSDVIFVWFVAFRNAREELAEIIHLQLLIDEHNSAQHLLG